MNFSEFIPQLFYDLIGRLIAGLGLIGTAYLAWGEALRKHLPQPLLGEEPSLVISLLGLTLASYMVSQILEGIWSLLFSWSISSPLDKRVQTKAREQAIKDFSPLLPQDTKPIFPGVPVIFDILRFADSTAGARLVKLRAELQLCKTLCLGWALIALTWFALPTLGPNRRVGLVLLLLGILALGREFWAKRFRFYQSTFNHWLIRKYLVPQKDLAP